MTSALRIVLCLLFVGCARVRVEQTDRLPRPTRSPEAVEVLVGEPDRSYIVIARLESTFEGALEDFDDLRRKMIDKAAELGGDGLILGPESKKSGVIFVPTPVATPIFFDKKKLTGEVIVFQ